MLQHVDICDRVEPRTKREVLRSCRLHLAVSQARVYRKRRTNPVGEFGIRFEAGPRSGVRSFEKLRIRAKPGADFKHVAGEISPGLGGEVSLPVGRISEHVQLPPYVMRRTHLEYSVAS